MFHDGSDFNLPYDVVAWLVSVSEVENRDRVAPENAVYPDDKDWLYREGAECAQCVLVLQGRTSVLIGRDGFRSEAGAFKVLAKDALRDEKYVADFSAFLTTPIVRFLSITKANFAKAKVLSEDGDALDALVRNTSTPRFGGKKLTKLRKRSDSGDKTKPATLQAI